MDLLGSVLQSLQIRDSSIALMHLRRPWGFEQWALRDVASLFMPLSGTLELRLPGAAEVTLRPGDVAVGFGGQALCRSDRMAAAVSFPQRWIDTLQPLDPRTPRTAPVQLEWTPGDRGHPDADIVLTLALIVDDVVRSPLLAMLPRLIVLPAGDAELDGWTQALARFVNTECQSPSPGYNGIARQIGNLVFSMALRRHVLRDGAAQASWLRGMRDPHIGPVLACLHQQPAQPWHMARLVRESGLSRSTFARRFHDLVGQPPMDYLCAVRMRLAAARLEQGERVAAVADAVGYRSEGAFRTAFVKHFDATPQAYARRHGA